MVEATVKIIVGKQPQVNLSLASTWNELTAKQLLYIAENWEFWQQLAIHGDSLRKVRSLLLLELCGFKKYKERRLLINLLSFVNESTGTNILDCTKFVFKKLNLTKNLLPKIRVGWKLEKWWKPVSEFYYGPADRLNDIDANEFSFAFKCYIDYENTKQVKHLDNLVAVLYRPLNKNYLTTGEIKVPFTNKLIEVYATKTKKLSFKYKYAVHLFFKGCLEYYSTNKKYAAVFRRAEKEQVSNGGSFLDTVIAMSGAEFGPFNDTKLLELPIFLKALNNKIVNSRKK